MSAPYVFAVIPARSGSKRLPGKNLRRLGPLSLVGHAVASAREAATVSRFVTGQSAKLTGYIRFPESAGALTPPENIAKRLWFTRDHLSMARALGWGEGGKTVAPFYVDLESPVPDNAIPKPGALTVHLKDDHMQYAVTWFAVAGAVVIAFGVWWRGQRRNPTL